MPTNECGGDRERSDAAMARLEEPVQLTLTRGELALVAQALEALELRLRRDATNGNPAFGRINPAIWIADAKAAERLADRLRTLART